MGRHDDPDVEKKDDKDVDQQQERDKLEEQERDTERSPQERLGNSFLADMVNPLFGAMGPGKATRGERDANPDDEEVIEMPGGDPGEGETWTDQMFGHPDWMPPPRRVLPLDAIARWLPEPFPDPRRIPPPPGVDTPVVIGEQPGAAPNLEVVRSHAGTWLRMATDWLDAAGLDDFCHMAGEGARVYAGHDGSRSRVLAVRMAAASLGLRNVDTSPRGLAGRLDLEAGVPHIDALERASHAEGRKVPFSAKLARKTLDRRVPQKEVAVPTSWHVARGQLMTAWSRLLRLRSASARLAPEDRDTGAEGLGDQKAREALEDRATALYGDILRLRVRLAGAAEVLAWASEPRFGLRAFPGLYATLEHSDRLTEQALNALRRIGMGMYAADPWTLQRCRDALVGAAEKTDGVYDAIIGTMSRWTAMLIEPYVWPEDSRFKPILADDETLHALKQLRDLQRARPMMRPAISGPFAHWPWIRAAAVLTAADQFAREGDVRPAQRIRRQLLEELWVAGDPGPVAVAMAWEAPVPRGV
jgi:hypothetical protein